MLKRHNGALAAVLVPEGYDKSVPRSEANYEAIVSLLFGAHPGLVRHYLHAVYLGIPRRLRRVLSLQPVGIPPEVVRYDLFVRGFVYTIPLRLRRAHYLVKRHAFDIDVISAVCYTAHRTMTQKPLGRYCKPSRAKKRNGSFFVCKQDFAPAQIVGGVASGISAVYFLHVIYKQPPFDRPQIQHSHDRLTVLSAQAAHYCQARIPPSTPFPCALCYKHRVVQNFRYALYFAERHFRVRVQYGINFLAAQVDILLHGPQPLQRLARRAQYKHLAARPAVPVPQFQLCCVLLVNAVPLWLILRIPVVDALPGVAFTVGKLIPGSTMYVDVVVVV